MNKQSVLVILFVSLLSVNACQVKESNLEDTSSANPDTVVSTLISDPEIIDDEEEDEEVVSDLSGTDSIFYYLIAEKSKQKGAFAQALIVTDSIVDVSNDQNNLFVILLQTGAGSYGGIKSDALPFQTVYSTLALLQFKNNSYTLLDHVVLPESGGQGLYYYEVFCEPVKITKDKNAVIMHEIDSEEGAGDSGHKYHTAKLFVSNNGELTEVLSYPVSHFAFSSDEVESYDEINLETTIAIQHSNAALYDIQLFSNGVYPDDQYGNLQFQGGEQFFGWYKTRYLKLKK